MVYESETYELHFLTLFFELPRRKNGLPPLYFDESGRPFF